MCKIYMLKPEKVLIKESKINGEGYSHQELEKSIL